MSATPHTPAGEVGKSAVPGHAHLPAETVRRVARLSRLRLSDTEIESARSHLASILGHVSTLHTLDLRGVEPMTGVGGAGTIVGGGGVDADGAMIAPPRDDVPGPILPTEMLMRLAPDTDAPFIRVPKVLRDSGEGGGP
ncbi:MAG: aspartyl/glutamyl-tRNA amidotransferase subunit C [Phycisphaerae bacterium]|nr:aspartyl/glutamyl-tRNA amidotransferase subunit C [Phycisphaerae bacterium]